MFTFALENLDYLPRRVFGLICLACLALLAYGLYLQHVVGLEPCPMCIVQRYALVVLAVWAGVGAAVTSRVVHLATAALMVVTAVSGAFVAARQSWLQWYPPEVASCGRDFYGMIETFPLKKVLPMIFRGSGDCSAIDWTFLGGTIANWSFVCFTGFALLAAALLWRQGRQR